MVPDKAGERFFSFFSEDELKAFIEKVGFSILSAEIMKDTFTTGQNSADLPRWISIYARKS
jgi:hypothetical protein